MKDTSHKLTALTAYDYSFAKIFDSCGIDIILIGDSLGNVIKGEEDTLKVSMSDMLYHTKNVSRGVKHALIIADMPYQSDINKDIALNNAKQLINSGAKMVKIEGAKFEVIKHLIDNNIKVCSHLGLEPQSIEKTGLKVQGRTSEDANNILNNAIKLEQIGISLIVLECIPKELAKKITKKLTINTIGIGAGVDTNGQILVCYDMLGIGGNKAKFVRNFALDKDIISATKNYIKAVKEGVFPAIENTYV